MSNISAQSLSETKEWISTKFIDYSYTDTHATYKYEAIFKEDSTIRIFFETTRFMGKETYGFYAFVIPIKELSEIMSTA